MKRVSILGVTGTIGQNAVSIIEHAQGTFSVEAVTAQDNAEALAANAKKLGAKFAVIGNAQKYAALKDALSGTDVECAAGEEALCDAAARHSDVVLSAIVGAAGLKPTLKAIERSATVALANKECLVCAGALLMDAVNKHGAMLIPVDSEHNGIFQVFDAAHPEWIDSITITASGGPFRTWTPEQMKSATPEQAVKHPNWNMGAKISVDSATLMNKGLELIEAYHLFPMKPEQLHIVIHPESIVHALVTYRDGSVLAQMSHPDMRTPIAYALSYPERIAAPVRKLDLAALKTLTFEPPNEGRFPALKLAREAMMAGGTAPATLNAANEVAVRRFLSGKINFLDITRVVEKTLAALPSRPADSLATLLAADAQAREKANTI